ERQQLTLFALPCPHTGHRNKPPFDVQYFSQQTYREKPQIKMGYGFTADLQPPAVEAKTITHFN
ncbi:hypothetical protein, partial [Pedobacter antarcticus]|uniref:hypothetical protein n=1 Tax=Pedobacter antarcticus TaxID=34086 RepID=UPI001F172C88